MKPTLFIVTIVLLASTLACGVSINVPTVQVGATQSLEINQTLPSGGGIGELTIEMAAGTLNVHPNTDDKLSGRIDYNVSDWTPQVTTLGNLLKVSQGHDTNFTTGNDVINDWDLGIGNQVPLDLTINAGAYKGRLDLSGLKLRRLEINDGASDGQVKFNVPNPETMEKLVYRTGASKVSLYGLANANFTSMSFDSGAGDYLLDFTGTFTQDATVAIHSGLSSLTIVIPTGMHAVVINNGAISNVTPSGTWTVTDKTYVASGEGPTLTITVDMAMGTLKLVHQ